MKDSKKYAKKVQKLFRSLKTKHSHVEPPTYDDPVEAVVAAILGEHLTASAAHAAFNKAREYFVDFNELRVSRAEEIASVIGKVEPDTVQVGLGLNSALSAVFAEYHKISLEPLKKIGKRPAKQLMEGLKGFSHFTVSYCMLTALQGHAIPLTPRMVEYLIDEGLVHPSADAADIEGFLTKQISAKDAFEFYALLRKEAESTKPKKKKPVAEPEPVADAKPKAAKKTATKKVKKAKAATKKKKATKTAAPRTKATKKSKKKKK